MGDEVTRLLAKRGGTRSVVTKLMKESEEIIANDELDDKTLQRLKRLQTTILQKNDVLESLDEEILQVCEVETIEKEIEDSEEYKMRMMDIVYDITRKLQALYITTNTNTGSQIETNQPQPPNTNETIPNTVPKQPLTEPPRDQQRGQQQTTSKDQPSIVPPTPQGFLPGSIYGTLLESQQPRFSSPSAIQATPNRSTDSASSTSSTRAKLPKLILPKFKGDILHFKTFWDSFESSVHKNDGLNNIDKLNYLKSLLEGSALRAIDGLPITDDKYRAAIDILTQRFGQRQQLISAYMDELSDFILWSAV